MDRIIEVKINGNYLTKDNKVAGVQHEGNVTRLRIEFDAGWDGYAKKVTWWDAKGLNPVKRTLTTDLLENINENTRIYLVPIPAEPMAEAGYCTFVIDGYADGKRARSVSDKLEVKYAPFDDEAGDPSDPTPTQAEQLQKQIDGIMTDIADATIAADAKESAQASAAEAAQSVVQAAAEARLARELADSALVSANTASGSAQTATTKASEAAQSAANASASANTASGAAQAAFDSALHAATYENTAKGYADAAANSISIVESAKSEAVTAKDNAGRYSTEAEKAAASAAASATSASQSAETSEYWAKQAEGIAGGDFATKSYVDDAAQAVQNNLNTHDNNTTKHITANERTTWNGKLDATQKGAANGVASLGSDGKVPTGQLPAMNYAPSTHANQHSAGGSDPITPGQIGAMATTGGTATDAIKVEKASYPQFVVQETTSDTIGVFEIDGENKVNVSARTPNNAHIASVVLDPDAAELSDVAKLYTIRNGAGAWHKLYGEHNKPSPADIGAAPAYTYGTADLTAGTSELETGKLYFVYE